MTVLVHAWLLQESFFQRKWSPKKRRNSIIFGFQKKNLPADRKLVQKKQKKTEVAWKWAFGPCGKFEITNTAGDQVDLIPGDFPGAGFR